MSANFLFPELWTNKIVVYPFKAFKASNPNASELIFSCSISEWSILDRSSSKNETWKEDSSKMYFATMHIRDFENNQETSAFNKMVVLLIMLL